ncbi:MAG: acetyltransferase [Bacteroidetes bacterium]|nr:acetyltransferase [Bacteroidota bacterium]
MEKICIIGAGGFAREVLCLICDIYKIKTKQAAESIYFVETDDVWRKRNVNGINVLPLSEFNPYTHKVVIAIGNPIERKKITEMLPLNTKYISLIHPSVVISESVEIAEGAVICAGTILTCNIKLGKHIHLNLHTTVGHDCITGNFFTTAPAVNISGNCKFGNNVYCGTNASFREGLVISDDVVIGMGAVVLKNIAVPGVYVGNPLYRLEK